MQKSVIDRDKLNFLMKEQGLEVNTLLAASGLSRQGFYDMFKENYQPFAKGILAVAMALGVSPSSILSGVNEDERDIRRFLEGATAGDARNFEVLPAALARANLPEGMTPVFDRVARRVLSAAFQVAHSITGRERFLSLAEVWTPDDGGAFFFGLSYMTPQDIIARTPIAMRQRNVFGVFELEDFQRHFA